jgi:hypothetical protein
MQYAICTTAEMMPAKASRPMVGKSALRGRLSAKFASEAKDRSAFRNGQGCQPTDHGRGLPQ